MIVCVCNRVSEGELNEVIEGGASSVEAVGDACGAGTDCGSCVAAIQHRLSCARRAAQASNERRLEDALPVLALADGGL